MLHMKTILHPTDFSEHSRYALELACALARDQTARVILLHVVPRCAPVTGPGDVEALYKAEAAQQELKAYREDMQERLRHVQAEASWLQIEPLFKEGNVADVVLSTADELNCDLIVMGTHGRTDEARTSLGSVAEVVTRKAPCPVLAVRLPSALARSPAAPVLAEVGRA